MKNTCIVLLLAALSGCLQQTSSKQSVQKETTNAEIQEWTIQDSLSSLQSILDSADFRGAILVYDAQKNQYLTNSNEWANQGRTPASTFKIQNSIIALELGIVDNETTILPWSGEKHWNNNWNQDLNFRDAFYYSCLPCYREIARKVGVDSMTHYLNKLDYPPMQVDSGNLDLFWLGGNGKITPYEQINFLQRLNARELPISDHTYQVMKHVMQREKTDTYTLYGKTGWSNGENSDNGWFVGYVESQSNIYYFATNVEPIGNHPRNYYFDARIKVTKEALQVLNCIPAN